MSAIFNRWQNSHYGIVEFNSSLDTALTQPMVYAASLS